LKLTKLLNYQNENLISEENPAFSKLGMQAKLIMGGGPHIKTMPCGDGLNKRSWIISKLTNPTLKAQSGDKKTIKL